MNALGRKLRIGAVSYLNTKPLVHGLAERLPDADLVYDLPSRLADRLAQAELDVALIPTLEYFQNSKYRLISDACIACRGPVLSVRMLSRVPVERIQTLGLDEGSRTSVGLLRVLLWERYRLCPKLVPLPLGKTCDQVEADAVLLIGDRAIHVNDESFVVTWDLGDEWCRWAELPFVFAMWTARTDLEQLGVDIGRLEMALAEARDTGLSHLGEIAETEASVVNLPVDVCYSYLKNNLHFCFGEREQLGLRTFHRYAVGLGLAPRDWNFEKLEVRCNGCEAT